MGDRQQTEEQEAMGAWRCHTAMMGFPDEDYRSSLQVRKVNWWQEVLSCLMGLGMGSTGERESLWRASRVGHHDREEECRECHLGLRVCGR